MAIGGTRDCRLPAPAECRSHGSRFGRPLVSRPNKPEPSGLPAVSARGPFARTTALSGRLASAGPGKVSVTTSVAEWRAREDLDTFGPGLAVWCDKAMLLGALEALGGERMSPSGLLGRSRAHRCSRLVRCDRRRRVIRRDFASLSRRRRDKACSSTDELKELRSWTIEAWSQRSVDYASRSSGSDFTQTRAFRFAFRMLISRSSRLLVQPRLRRPSRARISWTFSSLVARRTICRIGVVEVGRSQHRSSACGWPDRSKSERIPYAGGGSPWTAWLFECPLPGS